MSTAREAKIQRIVADVDAIQQALNEIFVEIDPEWKIAKCTIKGSLGRHLAGEENVFRTVEGGVSGSELRGEQVSDDYLSDVDVVCTVTEPTNFWFKGSLMMDAENKLVLNPRRFLPRSRDGKCVNYRGDLLVSYACNDPFLLPLDEPDFRKTHPVVLHLEKLKESTCP